MTWIVLTNSSSGAPRNSGTNGDLCSVLDWALPQASWAIEYSSGNARVYRPGSGNRHRLHVYHDSSISGNAGLALVRGCEDASSATSITDPFPLTSQLANNASNWLVSNTQNTTDREFKIYLSETFIYYFSSFGGSSTFWSMGCFGDVPGNFSSPYDTVCCVKPNTSTSDGGGLAQAISGGASVINGRFWWCRDLSSSVKSTTGSMAGVQTSSPGVVSGLPIARAGYGNRIYREKIGVNDSSAQTTTMGTLSMVKRGWLPNLWAPLHGGVGTITVDDTFTDTAYDPSASFRALIYSTSWLIVEETDTWSAPSG